MKQFLFTVLFTLGSLYITAQQDITSELYDSYEQYKEPSLTKRRIKHMQVQSLIQQFVDNPKFEIQKVGESIEGRDIKLVSIGSGDEDIFLWSQMHGDEPTATQAIFDILNFLDAPEFQEEKQEMLSKLKLHFIPMLNPDGAEVYQRRNALGIDINRDALRLQSPEGRILKRIRDSLDADFGFNLHDQSTYYNAKLTDKPATISYLATAYNYEKDINETRANAMKVIVFMNDVIQKYAPGQVGRYSDEFEPRAFGDNISKWGTSLILIESGGYKNDIEKQEIRKLNYVSILSALFTISDGSYKNLPLEEYEKIPRNDRKLFDLKIQNVTYNLLGKDYILDLGINRREIDNEGHEDFYYKSTIVDQGDLSTYYGYETFDASGYTIVPPKIYSGNKIFDSSITSEVLLNFLKAGYAYEKMEFKKNNGYYIGNELPAHIWNSKKIFPDFILVPGQNPTFFLKKEGEITHAVINGFLLDLSKPLSEQNFGNALIYR
ncbi:MAG: M14 family zinc carboxypeptidase [Bacteroidota bacterium]